MFKRVLIALAALVVMLGLAAAPANGETTQQQTITVYSEPNLSGDFETVALPATTCTKIPVIFDVRSTEVDVGTLDIAFFSDSACTIHLATLTATDTADFTPAAAYFQLM